jgi:hypothetical protein
MGVLYSHCLIPKDNTTRPAPERIVALIEAWVGKGFVVGPEGIAASERYRPMRETGACFTTEPPLAFTAEPDPAPPPEPQRSLWSKLFGHAVVPKIEPRPQNPLRPFTIPPAGDSLIALSQPYALIEWAPNPNAAYPMQTVAEFPPAPHRLAIELSDDFVNLHTDPYGAGAKQIEAVCTCGHHLNYEGPSGLFGEQRIYRVCPACGLFFRPQDHPAEIVDGATGATSPQPGGLCHRFAIDIDFGKDLPIYLRAPNGELVDAKPKVSDDFMRTCTDALGIELEGFDIYG